MNNFLNISCARVCDGRWILFLFVRFFVIMKCPWNCQIYRLKMLTCLFQLCRLYTFHIWTEKKYENLTLENGVCKYLLHWSRSYLCYLFHFQTQLEHGLLWNLSNTPWNKWKQNTFGYQQQGLFWRNEGSFYWTQGQALKGTDVEFYVLSPKFYYSITNFVCTIF